MRPLPACLALGALLLATGCAVADAAPVPGAVPPDLAGHQFDRPHASRVLVAGDTADLDVPGGRLRVRVTGPRLVPSFTPARLGELPTYTATFTLAMTPLSGSVVVGPRDVRLLDLHDQTGAAAPVPHDVLPTATDLLTTPLPPGRTTTRTFTVPVTEGHGELLLAPAGVAPVALWDFRAER
ncbi:MAG: hypothetical protein JWN17_3233 [Frankiales bacterium]|nr:hypothetical protein [Frankiales bacterium]